MPDKGWFWHIPQHNDMVSVGVVAEGKYLTRDGVKDPKEIFHREVEENQWIKDHLARGRLAPASISSPANTRRHSRHCAAPGLLLVGDAFAFLDPVFSSGVMLALKSGMLAGEAIHEGLRQRRSLARSTSRTTAPPSAQGVENMRKLVYAFYDPNFSFREVIAAHPEAGGMITDCLSGDVNKDFSQLWAWIREFVPLPDDLPYGEPLQEEEVAAAA